MKTIKPCPCCGASAHLQINGRGSMFVECGSCMMRTATTGKNEDIVIDAWNRRVEPEYANHDQAIGTLMETRDALGDTIADLKTENARLRIQLRQTKGGES